MNAVVRAILVCLLSFVMLFRIAEAACPPPGTYTIGPTGNYASITAAVADLSSCGTIAGAYIFELQSTYVSSVETFPINIPDFGGSAINTVTFRPQLGATGLSITSNNINGTLKLNGAKYVYFDGRPGGVGTAKQLTIENTDSTLITTSATAAASGTTITVSSTTGMAVGMLVGVGPGAGFFGPNNTITAINSATQFTVQNAPTAAIAIGNTITAGWTPCAVIFINGAFKNAVKYCKLKSANQNITSGTVYFATSVGTTGNNYNAVTYNDISECSTGSFPLIGVYAEAFSTAGYFNDADTISNNNIFNYYKASTSSAGALLRCSSNWVVSDNSFYQTATRNLTTKAVQSTAINVTGIIIEGSFVSATNMGNNNLIKGNYIGGSSSNCGGGALTYTGSGVFVGIGMWAGTTSKSSVDGNVVQNINYTSNGAKVSPRGIAVFTGTVDCINNTIGSQSISNSIQLTINQAGIIASLINAGAGNPTTGNIKLSNNTLGGVVVTSSTTPGFRAISSQGAPSSLLIDGNTINDISSASNITIRGIWSQSTGASNVFSNNTISKLIQTSTGTSGQVEGIYTQGTGNFNISSNTIYNLQSASRNVTSIPTIFGIEIASTGTSNIIEKNTIYALRATDNNASAVKVSGFYCTANSGGAFRKNKIYDLTNIHPLTTATITGIWMTGGNWTIANNMVSISNAANTNAIQIVGIYDIATAPGSGTWTRNYHYNSVYIGGTGNADTYGSAFQYNIATNSFAVVYNNIFVMERTKGAGSARFYALASGSALLTGVTSNYNILNCTYPSTVAMYNATDYTLAGWRTATSQDLNSYTSEYVPFVNTASGDLHINVSDATLASFAYKSNVESKGIVVATTDDFDTDSRPGPSGSLKGGASAPDIGADEVDLTPQDNIVWLGNSTDYSNTINWNTATVPTSADAITIPGGLANYPVITSSFSVKNVSVVGNTASITIDSTGILSISGTYGSLGTLYNKGEIILNGTTQQVFPGDSGVIATMNKLTVNNSAGLRINKSFNINGVLTPQAGDINLDNAYVVLVSDSSQTARVAAVNGSFSYTGIGKFVIQRYLPPRRAWRFVAAPIKQYAGSQTISEAWQERASGLDYRTVASTSTSIATDTIAAGYGTLITGGTAVNGFDQSPTNNSSIKYYNGTAWVTPPNTNSTSANSQEGWMLFVRGDRKNYGQITNQFKSPTITTLRPKGQLHTGSKTITSTGLTVIGNPYASSIDFHTAIKTGDVTDQYYMWDPYMGGTFGLGAFVLLTWNGTNYTRSAPLTGSGSSSIDNRYIPSGAAIMVDFGTGGSVTFNETDKVAPSKTVSFRTVRNVRTNLVSVEADGSNFLSDAVINLFDEKYNNAVDNDDAIKIANFSESFSIRRDGKLLAVEKRRLPETIDSIHYNWGLMKLRNYRLEITADSMSTEWVKGRLHDLYLNKNVEIDFDSSVKYDFTLTSNAASYVANRFSLSLHYVPPILSVPVAAVVDDAIVLSWTTDSEYKVKEYIVERSVNGIDFETVGNVTARNNSLPAEYIYTEQPAMGAVYTYRVVAKSFGEKKLMSSPVSVTFRRTNPSFYIYPNPVTGNHIFIQMNKVPVGLYTAKLINENAQEVLTTFINHAVSTSSEMIRLNTPLSNGHYHIVLQSPDKKQKIILPFVYKK